MHDPQDYDIYSALENASGLDDATLDDMAEGVLLWESPYSEAERMEAFMGFRRNARGAPCALRREDRIAMVRRFLDDYLAKNPIDQKSVRTHSAARLLLRLPRHLHAEALRCSAADGTSLNTFVVTAVASAVAVHDVKRRSIP